MTSLAVPRSRKNIFAVMSRSAFFTGRIGKEMHTEEKLRAIVERTSPAWVVILTPDCAGGETPAKNVDGLVTWTQSGIRVWFVDAASKQAIADGLESLNRFVTAGFPRKVKEQATVNYEGVTALLGDFCEGTALALTAQDFQGLGPEFAENAKEIMERVELLERYSPGDPVS